VNVDVKLAASVTMHGALGRYHQPPAPADVDPALGNPALKSSYYDQVSLGVEAALPAGLLATVTGFANYRSQLQLEGFGEALFDAGSLGPMLDLLLAKQLGVPEPRANSGVGASFGFELSLKRHVGRWFGMLG
jgi:hypothetical protein